MQQVSKPHVLNYFAGSTTATHATTDSCYGFTIINDGASDLTFTINGITITVKSGECFRGEFNNYASVTVTTTVAYRCYCSAFGY
jgi:hypothetical protein